MKVDIDPKMIYAVAKKEFMDNVRNKWVLVISILFAILTVIMSYFGGALNSGEIGFQGFEPTVVAVTSVSSILLPLIAIMLGYGTVISERESGSMGVMLACPVSRHEVVMGKFLGLGSVLFTTIFAGFGISGIMIAALSSGKGWDDYLLFILGTFIFTMVYLGFSILMSTFAQKRSTAIGGGVFIFFSGMIMSTLMIGVYVATGGNIMAMYTGGDFSLPTWYWILELFNFMDVYPLGAMLLFGTSSIMGISLQTPDFVSATSVFGVMAIFSLLTFVLSLLTFHKKDI